MFRILVADVASTTERTIEALGQVFRNAEIVGAANQDEVVTALMEALNRNREPFDLVVMWGELQGGFAALDVSEAAYTREQRPFPRLILIAEDLERVRELKAGGHFRLSPVISRTRIQEEIYEAYQRA